MFKPKGTSSLCIPALNFTPFKNEASKFVIPVII